ncbi:MAG: branched-chain amino acid transaminase [Tissierellaceae bacterium]
MKESYVFYQGKIVREDEVEVSVRSKIFNYGLGCFEGIRAYWDEEKQQLYGFAMEEHYQRLHESAKALFMDLPYTVEELCDFTVDLLKKNGHKETTYIRPVVYKGSNKLSPTLYGDDDDRIVIYTQALGSYSGKDTLRVAVSSWRRISDTMLPPRTKATAGYLNSALASMEVLQNGFDEAIFLTNSGHVCEGPGENIFLVKKGKLVTPPVSDDILEGITRKLVMDLAKNELGMEIVERSVARTELYNSEELFFSGTAMEVTGITEVDRRMVADGKEGPVTKELKKLFFGLTTGNNPKYAHLCRPVY